ncbi:MAG: 50S ribosomal protein L29 [Patescibacteria group bacterium]
MAEVREAKPTTTQSAGQPTGIDGIRKELAAARRDHRMQQLDSPTKLRTLRKSLARELTKERAARPEEADG